MNMATPKQISYLEMLVERLWKVDYHHAANLQKSLRKKLSKATASRLIDEAKRKLEEKS